VQVGESEDDLPLLERPPTLLTLLLLLLLLLLWRAGWGE
jgi:hypothetical protein